MEYIKKGYSVALMVDQRVSEGPRISFLMAKSHYDLPAQLSSRFGCDIVPIYISRDKNDIFEMEILDPINILESEKKNKELITKKINQTIEKLI